MIVRIPNYVFLLFFGFLLFPQTGGNCGRLEMWGWYVGMLVGKVRIGGTCGRGYLVGEVALWVGL